MKCDSCEVNVTDRIQCGGCKKFLGYCCASVTEVGYRKLGPERRANWRCSVCKSASSVAPCSTDQTTAQLSTEPLVTLDSLMTELRDIKSIMMKIPGLMNDVKDIKKELADVKTTCVFVSGKVEEFDGRLASVEKRLPEILQLQNTVASMETEIANLKEELVARDQWSRLNNVEIKGVPVRSNENLFNIVEGLSKAVGYQLPKTSINYLSRVPVYSSKEKSLVVSFLNRYVKEEFVAAARAKKLTAAELGFNDSTTRIFVNDHLSPERKNLLTKAKSLAKERNYQYVWVKFCKIHVRKNDSSHAFVIGSPRDLNKLT